jgi:hypothetical protein
MSVLVGIRWKHFVPTERDRIGASAGKDCWSILGVA